MIAQWQIDQFHQQGFLVVEEVLSSADIAALQSDFDGWVEESRRHATAWGETLDGRPRFDIERDHAPDHPSLRRVASPTEISEAYRHTALNSRMATIAAQLIGGSGTRFHHSKINSKLPHTATEVKWHQDFLFTPHSNDDIITALLMVSEVTPENGPLNVVPGSHQGPLWSHWQEGRFTGAVDDEVVATHCQQPQACFGPAGSVCFMHTRLLHASSPNETALPRTLFISVYAAEDALPYGENPLPSRHAGQLVAGEESGLVRSTNNQLRLPQKPRGASFLFSRPAPIAPACNSPTLRRFYDTHFRTTPVDPAACAAAALTSLNALAFQQSGKITAGSDMTFFPYEYMENNKPAGFDIELLNGLAKSMGREAVNIDTRFPNLIPGLQGGRFDITNSSMYITAERLKVIDMVPYLKSGRRSSPAKGATTSLRRRKTSAGIKSARWAPPRGWRSYRSFPPTTA